MLLPALFSPEDVPDDYVGLVAGCLIGLLHFNKGDLFVCNLVLGDEIENIILATLILSPRVCQSDGHCGQLMPLLSLWLVANLLDGRDPPLRANQVAHPPTLGGAQ